MIPALPEPMLLIIWSFMLILTRVTACMVSCPLFLVESSPSRIKTAGILVLSYVLFLSHPLQLHIQHPIACLVLEFWRGALIGIVVRGAAFCVNFAGGLIDSGIGFNFAAQMNLLVSESMGPMQQITQLAFSLLFFIHGGQQQLIEILAASLHDVPPGKLVMPMHAVTMFSQDVSHLIKFGVALAMPVVLFLLATQLTLALASRLAPQMNIWGVSFAATTLVGMICMINFIPVWFKQMHVIMQHSIARAARILIG